MKKVFALVDCNNFFVSCERVFNPVAARSPTVVLSSNDGCVVSRSQEVKDMGVMMGMPYFKMKQMFTMKDVCVFSSNFRLYRDMSQRVMNILQESVADIEIYSIDEAFLDITSQKNPKAFCDSLAQKVFQYTGIPVSIGVAPTKTLAKVASGIAKKQEAATFVLIEDVERIRVLQDLSVGKVWGIGRKMADTLHTNGITTVGELLTQQDQWIQKTFGVVGVRLVYELRGESCFHVTESETTTTSRKSIISSRSFGKAVTSFTPLLDSVYHHVRNVARQLRDDGNGARYITVGIYTNRHKMVPQNTGSKQYCFDTPVADTFTLMDVAKQLLNDLYQDGYEYVKSGITVSGFVPTHIKQHSLFKEVEAGDDTADLMKTIDGIQDVLGLDSISVGVQQKVQPWLAKRTFVSPNFTTDWKDIVSVTRSGI